MRKLIRLILFICLTFITYISCSTKFRIQTYDYIPYARLSIDSIRELYLSGDLHREDISITLTSDTTLNFFQRYGGLGFLNTIGYTRSDTIILIDSIDKYNGYSENQMSRDIRSKAFLYTKDSLVDIDSNELYYKRRRTRSNKKTGTYTMWHE